MNNLPIYWNHDLDNPLFYRKCKDCGEFFGECNKKAIIEIKGSRCGKCYTSWTLKPLPTNR